MEESPEIVKDIQKKSSRRKFIFTAAIIYLCFLAGYIYTVVIWKLKPDPASEKIIRQIVAKQLNKEPNELTDEDFSKIISLDILRTEISDFKQLEKFTNLQNLKIHYIDCPESAVASWMKVLAKLGIIDLNKVYPLDLSPLEKLDNLKILSLSEVQLKNIMFLKSLMNLQSLYLINIQTDNFKPIKELTNLQSLTIDIKGFSNLELINGFKNLRNLSLNHVQVSNLESIKGLANIRGLALVNMQVSDLTPIKGFTKLGTLILDNTLISNLEPIKGLINLRELHIQNCLNITDQQIEDLQKVLPNLEIR